MDKGLVIIGVVAVTLWALVKSKGASAMRTTTEPSSIVTRTTQATNAILSAAKASPNLSSPAIVSLVSGSPAVISGGVNADEALRAIQTVNTVAEAAVVARALEYAPRPTTEELRAMTPGQDFAYRYGVDEATGDLMSTMTAGELYAYNIAHGI